MIKSSLVGKREVELGSAVACREPKPSSKPRRVHLKSQGRADIQGFPSAVSRPKARRRPRCAWKVCRERRKKFHFYILLFWSSTLNILIFKNSFILELDLRTQTRFVLLDSRCSGDQFLVSYEYMVFMYLSN